MKKIIYILLLVLLAKNVSAQDFACGFIEKYGNKDLEVVSIGKQMLSALGAMSSSKDAEFKEAVLGLESIKIITADSKEQARKSFKNAYTMLTKRSEGFEEIMSVKEDNEETHIMVRGKENGSKELVLLSAKNENFSMICMSGEIDLSVLAKFANNIQPDKLKKSNTTKNTK